MGVGRAVYRTELHEDIGTATEVEVDVVADPWLVLGMVVIRRGRIVVMKSAHTSMVFRFSWCFCKKFICDEFEMCPSIPPPPRPP